MNIQATFAVLLFSASNFSSAGDVRQCDASLAPTLEVVSTDYSLAQSYMFVNAAYEYDKLKRTSSEEKGASVAYKFFSAEYNESASASEFQEKVRDRLTREGYSLQVSESRSSYRRYLSGAQLSAWSNCVQSVSGGGAVILIAESVSDAGFPVRVRWYPPTGIGAGTLTLRAANATISGRSEVKVPLTGVSEKPFIIVPDNTKKQIVLIAEIGGAADTLALPRTFPKSVSPPRVVRKPEKIVVLASSFLHGMNVALGGPNNAYGADVLLNGPDYSERANSAEFEFGVPVAGKYNLKIEYAAAVPRPVQVYLNQNLAIDGALSAATGCWETQCQRALNQGTVTLREGQNLLRIQRAGVFPHLRSFIFEPIN